MLFMGFRYEINPDAISYFSIAEKYAAGNFSDAINGTWSPMISFLLAPCASMGWNLSICFKIGNGIFGGVFLFFMIKIIDYFSFPTHYQRLCIVVCMIHIIYEALIITTPDLLSFAFAASFLYMMISEKQAKYPVFTGLIGFFMYLSKAYFFFIYVAYMLFSLFFSAKRKALIKSLFIFTLFAILWIIPLSYKYQKITISEAGKYNFWYIQEGKINHWIGDFLPPPNATAYYAWEDILAVYDLPQKQKTWQEKAYFQVKRSVRNVLSFCKRCLYLQPFALVVFLFACVRYKKEKFTIIYKKIIAFLLLYITGYSLLFWEDRYLWWVIVLSLPISVEAYIWLSQHLSFLTKKGVWFLFFLIMAAYPLYDLHNNWNMDKDLYVDSQSLNKIMPPHQKWTLWNPQPNLASRRTWYYAYYATCQDFGYLPDSLFTIEKEKLMNKYNISYIFIDNHLPTPDFILNPYMFSYKKMEKTESEYNIWKINR